MIRKYAGLAFAYAIAAMALGVFYREYTKIIGFHGQTTLSVMHTHYFMLGMFFFLALTLLEKNFRLSDQKVMRPFMLLYNLGLNVTGLGLFARGLIEVGGASVSRGLDASVSGVSGLGHILLSAGILLMLIALRRQVRAPG